MYNNIIIILKIYRYITNMYMPYITLRELLHFIFIFLVSFQVIIYGPQEIMKKGKNKSVNMYYMDKSFPH